MVNNTLMIILILVMAVGGLIYFVKKTTEEDTGLDEKEIITVDTLMHKVNETFAASIKRSINDMNLNSEQYKKKMANKEELKSSIHKCSDGDAAAKHFVKQYTQDVITDERIGKVSPVNIDAIIPFNDPDKLLPRYKFELLVMLWKNEEERGFSKNFSKYELDKPKETTYGAVYDVTKEDISRVYDEYIEERGGLDYSEKIDFLTQLVYEKRFGLGPVDLLHEVEIDEYQGGTSGIPAGRYDITLHEQTDDYPEYISDYEKSLDEPRYSFEAVWIVYHGLNIHLSCTTFETQKELQRVTRNIYRYNAPTILTEKDPKIISTMKDGSRVAVMCPPFSDSYAFLCRKFDSTPSILPEKLLTERKKEA